MFTAVILRPLCGILISGVDIIGEREAMTTKRELEFQLSCTLEQARYMANALDAAAKERDRYRDALNTAVEAMDERRGYCEAWEWKYGKEWDEEDKIVREALTNC